MALKQFYLASTGAYTASGSMGIYINSDTFLNTPAFDYSEYNVPGRDGNLIAYNKRLTNVTRRFDCYIKDNVEANLNKLKKFLYTNPGYIRIKSDYEPDVYMYGYLAQEIEVAPFDKGGNYSIQFSLYFSCTPYKYFLSTSQKTVTAVAKSAYIIDRNTVLWKSIMEQLPQGNIPDDKLFYVLYVGSGTYTNVTASSNVGNNFFALFELGASYFAPYFKSTQVFGSGLNSLPNVESAACSSSSHGIYLICGYNKAGIVRKNINGTITDINLARTGLSVAQGTGMIGADLDVLHCHMINAPLVSAGSNYIVVTRDFDGVRLGTGLITIFPNRTIPSMSDYPDYFYTENDEVCIDIDIDLEKRTVSLVRDGCVPVNINDYALIEGEFGGYTDKLFVSAEPGGNMQIENVKTTPKVYRL